MIWQLIYVTTNMLRWGAGLGGPLTAGQIDKNFGDLEERVWEVENNPPAANGIASITQGGNTITVHLEDGATSTFNLPLPIWDYVGDWAPNTGMFRGNIFTYQRTGLYLALQDHVTDATFNSLLTDTDGPVYRFMFNPFAASAVQELVVEETDTIYSPVLADANSYMRWPGPDDLMVLVPANAQVPYQLDTELHFHQSGSGYIEIVGDDGVIIHAPRLGYNTITPWQGATITLKQVAIDEWDYIGSGTESTSA